MTQKTALKCYPLALDVTPAKISEKNTSAGKSAGGAASKVDNFNESSGGVNDADEFACIVDR